MGLGNLWRRLFGGAVASGHAIEELARRLDRSVDALRAVRPVYRPFTVTKRPGGQRQIFAPDDALKAMQRRILRRLLDRLACHPAAQGFERGQSIVTHASRHVGQAVVLRLDLQDFFTATRADRVAEFFRQIGWNAESVELLTRLCTYHGGLPQGAPTSPRLSNLVNYRLDARLDGLARSFDAVYSRYADDMTFSFADNDSQSPHAVIRGVKAIVAESGYTLHQGRKLRIFRHHHRQVVTGLVVNESLNLPRNTRRRLRAIEHHLAAGRPASLTPSQLGGWRAFQSMIAAAKGQ
jgi:retron-type reverse transcriptase